MYGITGATIIGPSRAMPPVGAVDRNPLGVEKSGLYKIFKSITIWIIFMVIIWMALLIIFLLQALFLLFDKISLKCLFGFNSSSLRDLKDSNRI